MAVLDITIILLLLNFCSVGNARVIETTTLTTEGTTMPVLPLNESTTPTATEETSNPGWPKDRTTTLTIEETERILLCPSKTTSLTTEGTTRSLLPLNSTTILRTPIPELMPSNETTTLATEGTETPVLPSNETTLLTTDIQSNLTTVTTELPTTTIPALLEINVLDLAFIMDTTGSMGSYIDSARQNIRTLVDKIAGRDNTDLRVALVEYRDHPPQERTFVTRTHDFTRSIKTMKRWLRKAHAHGGGDGPEAVAEGLYDVATKLSWRPEAAKISVLISDAPPHGLVPSEDRSFQEGSPNGHDPIEIVRDLTKREITLYSVGCEPSINKYKDFFMMLAYSTGGQYIPLSDPEHLIDAIIGGAQEEMSLQKFSEYVEEEIKRVTAICGTVDEGSIAMYVYNKLHKEGATSKQLLRNNKPLEGASDFALSLASSVSMADVRKVYEKVASDRRSTFVDGGMHYSESMPAYMPASRSRLESAARYDIGGHERAPIATDMYASESMPEAYYESEYGVKDVDLYGEGGPDSPSDMTDTYASERMPEAYYDSESSVIGTDLYGEGGLVSSSSMTDVGESYSTVESAVSLDQIMRLVRKKTAKLSGV
ncbi:uncharacterized protein LOC123552496 [Mercenaria mercenaria]|uniref:uncharacterized protein LOC123552496 n=1 Tax=Mercenaria mercenaria TaxID=6596 RepID=UPI00234E6CDB|nr:uncharacterized protein LOC123552496 [Mercenaria mercenaria]